jgi:pyruvate ferredoxin oxidoreductase alpha subunit
MFLIRNIVARKRGNFSKKVKKMKLLLTGGHAVAHAMKQINPAVVAAYPITPQTPIIEKFAEFVAKGEVDSEFVRVESEHSALSVAVGASAAGVRAMSATSSQGLLYMYEVLGVASGFRLPIVMPIANRAISAPINIHCDHTDSMLARDLGWIQIYSENSQEAYENVIFALKLSETNLLPSMVMLDGFILSHSQEIVHLFEDSKVKDFIGEHKRDHSLLDFKNWTFGPLALPDWYFEIRREILEDSGF